MQKIPRYLITTSDEVTWKFDRPVIFLGEWCRTYDRQHIWKNMDAIVARPYGLGLAQKDADYKKVCSLEEKLLSLLCDVLNEYHSLQNGKRFWRIFLGNWLRRYVQVMLNRVKTLEMCLQSHEILGTTTFSNSHFALAAPDSYMAIWAFNDSRWNNVLNARILNLLEVTNFPLEVVTDCETTYSYCCFNIPSGPLEKISLKWLYYAVGKLLNWFASDSDAFFMNSYLPKKIQIKLQLALKQIPQFWISPRYEVAQPPNKALREKLAIQSASKSHDKLENILSSMLFELLPVCYLEGFAHINMYVKKKSWPRSPKFIFTSNNFDTDEVFKLWVANKVKDGLKYFVGQHGNNYGTHRYFGKITPEELYADKFITWGWIDGLPQHMPSFIFKHIGKSINNNPQGGLLLIEECLNHRITTWDSTYEFGDYFENQQNLVSKLAINPRQNLTIRLPKNYKLMKWHEEARWKAFDPLLKIDSGTSSILDLIADSRLVLYSYDSTGMLETLSQNIPTLAFWQNDLNHLRESAKPFYQLLVDVGIVHLTVESVAHKINVIWGNVEAWWSDSKVQDARKIFCDRYAKQSKNPTQDLFFLLTDKK